MLFNIFSKDVGNYSARLKQVLTEIVSTTGKCTFSLYGYIVPHGAWINMQGARDEQFCLLENMPYEITCVCKVANVVMMA